MTSLIRWSVAAAAAMLMSAAHADYVVTYSFTGTIDAGYGYAGQSVQGQYTVDFSSLDISYTDGSTYNAAMSSKTYSPMPTAGQGYVSLSGGYRLDVGTGDYGSDQASASLQRSNAPVGENFFFVGGVDSASNQETALELGVYDELGASTQIFSTPPGDRLSLTQTINFFAPGATSYGQFLDQAGTLHDFSFTSLTVAVVPEPATYALLLVGLAGLALTARRRNR